MSESMQPATETTIERVRRYIVGRYHSSSKCDVCHDRQWQHELPALAGWNICCCTDSCTQIARTDLEALSAEERGEVEQLIAYFEEHPHKQFYGDKHESVLLCLCTNPTLLEMVWSFEESKRAALPEGASLPGPRTAELVKKGFSEFLAKHAELIRKIRFCWGLYSGEDWFQRQQRSQPGEVRAEMENWHRKQQRIRPVEVADVSGKTEL